ncbi:SDR family oxidoreductase [Rhizobium sp. P32RR-XVIII]|uniref:SDR family NAD(P)-dependent oxidoreductase n=1 Tax=Rhizobium sp. P32RR-XVIII TaxID=2726738 RepID=UPI00145719A0|nr:SDR family NAD(P)-dependent oxidoreductase [Rhizobium sp. P32RR-XVIII]NLS04200.1 SDR family oxidoreductase [Rhizobium sp. P32RR-XVIII]
MNIDAAQPMRPTAVVTGGAKGIGRAIVLALAERGYNVAVVDILDERGCETAEEASALGADCKYVRTDVADEQSVVAMVDKVRAQLGEPHVLVNNAGIYPRHSAAEMPYELWQHVLAVNLGGAFLCSRTIAPFMLQRGNGVIVNVASGRALQGAAGGSHYAASKAGLLSLTRSLALEWAPTLRVNAVIPGVTDTDQPREGNPDEKALYARGQKIPLGRIGQPEDVAKAVCFFLSTDASYVTGQSLCVNGRLIMH